MRHESTASRQHASSRLSAGLRGAAIAGSVLAGCAAARAADVVVRVDGVVPTSARVLVSLCSGGLEPEDCGMSQGVPANAPVLAVRFADVPPGAYAAAAFEDVNGNGVLDRSPRGLPREPYGFSREAGRTSSPRFERAAVLVERDVSITVHLGSPGRP